MKKCVVLMAALFVLSGAASALAGVYSEDFEGNTVDAIWDVEGDYAITDGVLHMNQIDSYPHQSTWVRLRVDNEFIYRFEADVKVSSNQLADIVLQWWLDDGADWTLYQVHLKFFGDANEFQASLGRETQAGGFDLGRVSLGSGNYDQWYSLSITVYRDFIRVGIDNNTFDLFHNLYPYPDSVSMGDAYVHGHDAVTEQDYYVDNIRALSSSSTEVTLPVGYTYYDDFEGADIDTSLWDIYDSGNVLSQSGGFLQADGPPNAVYGQLHSTQTFEGDFEVVLEYSDFQSTATEFSGNVPQISLETQSQSSPGDDIIYIFSGGITMASTM